MGPNYTNFRNCNLISATLAIYERGLAVEHLKTVHELNGKIFTEQSERYFNDGDIFPLGEE